MTQKFVAIYQQESYSKQGTDRKGISDKNEDCVTTHLKPNAWCFGRNIYGPITIHTSDSQAPDWNENFIVTIEKLPPKPEGVEWDEYANDIIEKKQLEGTAKPVVGRKFR